MWIIPCRFLLNALDVVSWGDRQGFWQKRYGIIYICRKQFHVLIHSWTTARFVTRVTQRVPLVEQELPTLPEHLSSPWVLVGFVLLDRSLIFSVVFCRSLFALFWPLCCLSFLDIGFLITPLVSSNSSYTTT